MLPNQLIQQKLLINPNIKKANQNCITKRRKNYFKKNAQLRGKFGSFAIKKLLLVFVLGNEVCDETVSNLSKKKGYKFLHSREKGLLKPKDLKERLKFLEKIKMMFKENTRADQISFYLDRVGYQHNCNSFYEVKSVKS